MNRRVNRPGIWIAIIMVAIFGWGVFHAIGAYSLNRNPWRPLVVVCFSLGFLGFWLLMLASRRRRNLKDG
jgi:hypothetical protein